MATTYDNTNLGAAVGNLESIARNASIVSASKTPFLSTNKRSKAEAIKEEWLIDDRAQPNPGAAVEGKDATFFADPFKDMARVNNYIQSQERTATISMEQAAVKKASSQDKAEIIAKTSIDLNVDVEAALLSNNVRSLGNGSDQGRTMAGLADMLSPTSTVWSDNMDRYKPTAAQYVTNTSPTESGVDDILATLFTLSGDASNIRCYAHAKWAQAFGLEALRTDSGTSKLRVNLNAEDKTLSLQVKIFQSQFGRIEIFLLNPRTSFRADLDTAYFVDPNFVEIKTLGTPIHILPQINGGGGDKWVMRTMNTLLLRNPRTSAYWQSGS